MSAYENEELSKGDVKYLSTCTAFTLALLTVPARFGSDQHGSVRQCKRVQTVPCRAGPARIHSRGLARHGTVVAASYVNANRASYRALCSGNGAAEETGPSASAEEPAAPEKTKQQQIGKKRALKEEQFERAMDTAVKKLNAANEESDSKYFELEEKRLKLEERAMMETQMQQRQEFQQMVCCAFLQTFSSTPLLFMYIP